MGVPRGAKRAFSPLEIGTRTQKFLGTWNQQFNSD